MSIENQQGDDTSQELLRARQRVSEAVLSCRTELVRAADWRTWVAMNPGAFLGGAFFLGLLWGTHRASEESE